MAGTPAGRGTATSRFGVSRRESHDASEFYARFHAPEVTGDDRVAGPVDIGEPLRCADARALDLPDGCVALVVTSPPYFA
ncbi:MAG TPA: site-specific DNA-methyltransferase, partial [Acidimicrobiia bacterium]|nr:site-specific DNA-methyltransferase [Acidimicrobiia bacterium]